MRISRNASTNMHRFSKPFVKPNLDLISPQMLVPDNGQHPIFDMYVFDGTVLWCISFTVGCILAHYRKDTTLSNDKRQLCNKILAFSEEYKVDHICEIYFAPRCQIERLRIGIGLNTFPLESIHEWFEKELGKKSLKRIFNDNLDK